MTRYRSLRPAAYGKGVLGQEQPAGLQCLDASLDPLLDIHQVLKEVEGNHGIVLVMSVGRLPVMGKVQVRLIAEPSPETERGKASRAASTQVMVGGE